jgi:FlaA1/EpsC-like NDP-sugar epimerase
MIRLMGRTVRDANNPDGDIAIDYVGLRPGEKLREELLIGSSTRATEHPRIQSSDEPWLPLDALDAELAKLEKLIAADNLVEVHKLLTRVVEGYHIGGMVAATGAPPLGVQPTSQAAGDTHRILH